LQEKKDDSLSHESRATPEDYRIFRIKRDVQDFLGDGGEAG
jgi:hypothetical protein